MYSLIFILVFWVSLFYLIKSNWEHLIFVQKKNNSYYLIYPHYPIWVIVYIYQIDSADIKATFESAERDLGSGVGIKKLNSVLKFYKKHKSEIDQEIESFKNRPNETAKFFTHSNKNLREILKYIYNNYEHYFYQNTNFDRYTCIFKNVDGNFYYIELLPRFFQPDEFIIILHNSDDGFYLAEVLKSYLSKDWFISSKNRLPTNKLTIYTLEDFKQATLSKVVSP